MLGIDLFDRVAHCKWICIPFVVLWLEFRRAATHGCCGSGLIVVTGTAVEGRIGRRDLTWFGFIIISFGILTVISNTLLFGLRLIWECGLFPSNSILKHFNILLCFFLYYFACRVLSAATLTLCRFSCCCCCRWCFLFWSICCLSWLIRLIRMIRSRFWLWRWGRRTRWPNRSWSIVTSIIIIVTTIIIRDRITWTIRFLMYCCCCCWDFLSWLLWLMFGYFCCNFLLQSLSFLENKIRICFLVD